MVVRRALPAVPHGGGAGGGAREEIAHVVLGRGRHRARWVGVAAAGHPMLQQVGRRLEGDGVVGGERVAGGGKRVVAGVGTEGGRVVMVMGGERREKLVHEMVVEHHCCSGMQECSSKNYLSYKNC